MFSRWVRPRTDFEWEDALSGVPLPSSNPTRVSLELSVQVLLQPANVPEGPPLRIPVDPYERSRNRERSSRRSESWSAERAESEVCVVVGFADWPACSMQACAGTPSSAKIGSHYGLASRDALMTATVPSTFASMSTQDPCKACKSVLRGMLRVPDSRARVLFAT